MTCLFIYSVVAGYLASSHASHPRTISVEPLYTAYYTPGCGEDTFTYNTQGKIVKHTYEDGGMLIETTFAYGADGNVSSTISKIEDSNTEKTSMIKVTYTVQAKDAKGNWTKRTAKRNNGTSWVENRTITYYSAK